jgi:hypothetical protein
MQKKSQITLFIILGILILFVMIFFFMLLDTESGLRQKLRQTQEVPLSQTSVQVQMESCIRQQAEQVLLLMGVGGGNFDFVITENSSQVRMKTFYQKGKNITPALEDLERTMEQALTLMVPDCVVGLELPGMTIEEGEPSPDVVFAEEDVFISLRYPLKIEGGDVSANLDKFVVRVPVRMQHLYEIANEIVQLTLQEPNQIDYAALAKYDILIQYIPQGKDNGVYALTDPVSLILDRQPYLFLFGMRYEP